MDGKSIPWNFKAKPGICFCFKYLRVYFYVLIGHYKNSKNTLILDGSLANNVSTFHFFSSN